MRVLSAIFQAWEAPFRWTERRRPDTPRGRATALLFGAIACAWALLGLFAVLELISRLVTGDWLGW